MSGGGGKVWPLQGNQRPAVDPARTVWLSASAGTGKTQVLSARVLRLLLQPDVEPGQLLCLTFTKAGAAEMSNRISEVLARWVRLDDEALGKDLKAIGAPIDEETRNRARTLFAAVLDCPGGGLRIDTIHAFAQWLLAAFPHEAGLIPGVRAMEDRDRALLLREVLAELLLIAERDNDRATLEALATLSVRLGAGGVEGFLLRCAEAREAWEGTGGWQPPMHPRLLQALGLMADATHADLAELCADHVFPGTELGLAREALVAWNTATAQKAIAVIDAWNAADPAARVDLLDALHKELITGDGAVRSLKNVSKHDEGFADHVIAVAAALDAIRQHRALLDLAQWLAPVLELGRRFALAWEQAKSRAGLIDFDDQIRAAAALLSGSDMGQWIRYKLDRRFDHILVDEAQDTNEAQWQIIDALTGDFFAGRGARGDVARTLFVVGDYKQAIFRFQGTSPENFRKASERVRTALSGREEEEGGDLRALGLGQSYRTAQEVLDFVDLALNRLGGEALGLTDALQPHAGQDRPGQVVLWRAVGDPVGTDESADEGEEGWLSRADRKLADTIARQVREWLRDGYWLVKDGANPRRAGPGDIMILVRKRKELAGLIVGRLHAAGVPVAGVDRLRLAAPLGVRDLMAALRFATQPRDELNLAALLVSPLLGWSQDDLLELGYRARGVNLWDHLRGLRTPLAAQTVTRLVDLLNRADYDPPQALLYWLLVGPWQARRKLVVRLGQEVNDPVDELLNAAGAYASGAVPSLVGFIRWFDADAAELKREAGKPADLVRVMTVHGSKGLQAPIVLLADAADDPDKALPTPLVLADPHDPARVVPVPGLRKAEKFGALAEAETRNKAEERQEHWRLLYVAMTRAEEALFIAGALPQGKTDAPAASWYALLRDLFLAEEWIEDPLWGARLEHGTSPGSFPAHAPSAPAMEPSPLPQWLTSPSPAEPRPPRPLAPSALGEELSADPPFAPGTGHEAARRGVLMHKLLERLPDLSVSARQAAARSWLERQAADLDDNAREAMVQSALRVTGDPRWAEVFSSAALAEVPVAATLGDRVIVGTIDRLLIEPDRIRLIDFKTARRPPAALDQVPVATIRQMAAYAGALMATYPGRRVEAALLYTQTPCLIELPQEVIADRCQELIANG